jgi:phage shock protein A
MSIIDRLQTVIRSNLNSLVGSAEDPDKLIAQTILDMKAEVKRARAELVTTLGTSKRLEKRHAELETEIAGWENKAVLALKSGDDALAREALKRKARVTKESADVAAQAAAQASSAEEMQSALVKVEERIADLEARKTSLAAQVRKARSGPDDIGALGGSKSGALGELDRMMGRIDQMEAEVEAYGVLDDPKRAVVDAELRSLERDAGEVAVDDELAALKRKLGG